MREAGQLNPHPCILLQCAINCRKGSLRSFFAYRFAVLLLQRLLQPILAIDKADTT